MSIAEYALRALVAIARSGRWCKTSEIAREQGLPAMYLAKVLQLLVYAGFLQSRKGPLGGFALRIAAEEITISHVLTALHRQHQHRDLLLFGMAAVQRARSYQARTTIADLARQKKAAA